MQPIMWRADCVFHVGGALLTSLTYPIYAPSFGMEIAEAIHVTWYSNSNYTLQTLIVKIELSKLGPKGV
ncbi:hypothetical protein Csa_009535, partial [Cucumis sativus]